MNNVEITNGNGVLTIKIKMDKATVKAAPLSNTGKTRLLASTGGAAAVDCSVAGLKVALNVMIPPV